jgi:hypothetical protein
MIDKTKLPGKHVILRISSFPRAFGATVNLVEADGFWLSSPDLFVSVAKGTDWGDLKKPVLFVPTSHLEWLIVPDEESA